MKKDYDDVCFAIYDKSTKLFYCGMKAWDKQVRKAQLFHSKTYLNDRMKVIKDETGKDTIAVEVGVSVITDL